MNKRATKYVLLALGLLILFPLAPLTLAGFISYKIYKSDIQKRWLIIFCITLLSLFSFPSWLNLFSEGEDITEVSKSAEQSSSLSSSDFAMTGEAIDSIPNLEETAEVVIDREKTTVVRVIDGDTVEVTGGRKVRYIGIDAPELSGVTGCYAKESANRNEAIVGGKEIEMEKDVSEMDQYGRLLRYIYVGEEMVNETLIKEGYAQVSTYPPDVKNKDMFVSAEQEARENKKGLWGNACACKQETISVKCSSCNTSIKTIQNYDCSTNQQTVSDTSCAYLCPKPESKPAVQKPSGSYTCNCKKTCPQMGSCAEAQYQLNVCGCAARDADNDGVACDSDCQ